MSSLTGRLGFEDTVRFLGYVVELDSGRIHDEIRGFYVKNSVTLYILLAHYSNSNQIRKTGKLVRFAGLPGGYAYENAFTQRAVLPVAKMFGKKPDMLVKASRFLGGVKLSYPDVSVEIPALPEIPLTYTLWYGDGEFESSTNILFDACASNYLPTEDLAVLAELTTLRLEHVNRYRKLESSK